MTLMTQIDHKRTNHSENDGYCCCCFQLLFN